MKQALITVTRGENGTLDISVKDILAYELMEVAELLVCNVVEKLSDKSGDSIADLMAAFTINVLQHAAKNVESQDKNGSTPLN